MGGAPESPLSMGPERPRYATGFNLLSPTTFLSVFFVGSARYIHIQPITEVSSHSVWGIPLF